VSGPPRTLREDVHIHAPATEVYERLVEPAPIWWPPAVSGLSTTGGGLSFTLGLAGRSERVALTRASDEPPHFLEFLADGEIGGVRALRWVVNDEGPREVHLIAELTYEPAGGGLGWMLEETVHRPGRRQALRDALWRLKLLVEGRQ
jgi:hypothetical protein